jgi:2-oxoglutarate ferredoxin oxidoreductase subunit gamma
MVNINIIMAGFGGQGVLMAGKLLAYAGLEQGKEVSWFPSYGVEMRGGTANVTVCISDKPIGSPVVKKPHVLLAFNQPSLAKFYSQVKINGLIVINSSLISIDAQRNDCTAIYVEATNIAKKIGTVRAANMVMLGAYVGYSRIVTQEIVIKMIEKQFAHKAKFVPTNIATFKAGFEYGEKTRIQV